jgi:hypothetical protein
MGDGDYVAKNMDEFSTIVTELNSFKLNMYEDHLYMTLLC